MFRSAEVYYLSILIWGVHVTRALLVLIIVRTNLWDFNSLKGQTVVDCHKNLYVYIEEKQ